MNFAQEDDLYVPPLQRSNHRIQVDPIGNDEVLLRWYRTQTDPESQQLAIKLETRLLDHWREEGEKCEQQGRFVAAVSAMRESLRIKPDYDEALERVRKYAKYSRTLTHCDAVPTQCEVRTLTSRWNYSRGSANPTR